MPGLFSFLSVHREASLKLDLRLQYLESRSAPKILPIWTCDHKLKLFGFICALVSMAFTLLGKP